MSLFNTNKTRISYISTETGEKVYPVLVDVKKGVQGGESIQFVSSDINTGMLSVAFMLDNADYNVSDTEVICTIQRPDATILEIPCKHISNNVVEVYLGVNGTSQGGTYTFDFKVYKGGDKVVGTPILNYTVSQSISSDNSIEEDDRLPVLNNLIIQVNNAIENIPSTEGFEERFSSIEEEISSIKENGVAGKGEKGDKGDTGLTPDISIGNVITLEPNQQATVTRRGTNENPIFDFGIPKGAKGENGGASSNAELELLHSVTLEENIAYIDVLIDNKDEIVIIYENVLFTPSNGGFGITVNENNVSNGFQRTTRGHFLHTTAPSRGTIHIKHLKGCYYSVTIVGMNSGQNDNGSGVGFIYSKSEKIYKVSVATDAIATKSIVKGSTFQIYGR